MRPNSSANSGSPLPLPEKPKFAAELEEAIAQGYADGLSEAADTEKEAAK